jgi:hypothetical protein
MAEWQEARKRLPGLSRTNPDPQLLADYQRTNLLPITAQMDSRTRQFLTKGGEAP